jgi:hypothetical protein
MDRPIAQMARFWDRSDSENSFNGTIFWVSYGPPNERTERCIDFDHPTYAVAEGPGQRACSNCTELLPVFRYADGREVDSRC